MLGRTEGRAYGTLLGRIDTGFRQFRMGLRSTPTGRVEFMKLSATHVFGKLGGFGVLRVATFSTFESENSALAVELILSARSQGGIGLTRCVDD